MAIDREKVRQAAEKFVEKKKYDKAVLEYQKLVQADPADARTLLKIGDLQTKMAAFADAIGTYETVGKLYSQQGFSLKAIAVYKQIREIIAKHVPQLDEKYSHISPKLAELYQSLGLTSDALAALDEVATRLQRQQRDQEAIEVFRKIVDLDPTNPLPHLRLAEALSRIKDVEGAVFEFKTAASQLAGLGRRDDALKVLERLLHHKPDAEQARIAAELYLARGQPADGMQALSKLQLCFQANPRDFDTLSLLARAFTVIGQAAKAIEVQKEMARVARDAGKHDLFREIVERLARLAPHDDGVRKLLAQTAPEAAPPPPAAPAQQAPMGQMGGGLPQPPGMRQPAPGFQPPPQQAYQPPPQQAYQPPPQQAYQPPPQRAYQPPPAPMGAPAQAWGQQAAQAPQQAYELPDEEQAYEEEQGYEEPADYEMVEEDDLVAEAEPEAEPEPVYEEEAPEEIPAQDPAEQIAQILADAQSFRRVRLYTKAIETLRVGLELDPRSMDVHEAYRDTLIEAGHTEEAIDEMLAIAGLYVDALDGDSAARALQDVLAFDPENARAIEMLQELGYEIVDEGQGAELEGGEAEPVYADAEGELAAQEPLPSYDLEGVGPEHVSGGYRAAEPEAGADFEGEDALPSFPLDGPSTEDQPYAEEQAYVEGDDVAYAEPQDEYAPGESEITDGERAGGYATDEQQVVAAGTDRPPAGSPSVSARAQDLEDALEEAEFFMSRGLNEDARAILVDQLTRHPHNPLLQERIAEIDAQLEAMGQGSGARERPRYEDRAFDIAASLDALDGLEGAAVPEAQAMMGADEQIDVEEVFAKFKEGVAKQISIEDSESHYNLGIAYKEMGLIDDAIREFEVAARDPKRECVCQSMIGAIYVERGNLNGAIDALLKGIASTNKEPQQELMLWFEVASCYEAKKMGKDALSYYQKVAKRDPAYRDVQERIQRLSKGETKSAVRQVAVGADDEFDQAFDDIIGKS